MIAVDTSILIWGVRQESPEGREDLVARCVQLLRKYRSERRPIMVPSVVLAEYLVGCEKSSRETQRDIIGKNFFIAPFDAKAAAIAADLYDKSMVDEIRTEMGIGKQCIKADIKILATAIAHGASHIYVNDEQMRVLAQGKIIVNGIPTLERDLFMGIDDSAE